MSDTASRELQAVSKSNSCLHVYHRQNNRAGWHYYCIRCVLLQVWIPVLPQNSTTTPRLSEQNVIGIDMLCCAYQHPWILRAEW